MKKRRRCSVCGRDLTGRNFSRIWDEGQKKTVIVCNDDRTCYQKKMHKNWSK